MWIELGKGQRDNIVTINREWNRSAIFRRIQWLKIIPNMIRSYYRCWCINKRVIFSRCVHLKRGHRFHALSRVCSDPDDVVPLRWGDVPGQRYQSLYMYSLFRSKSGNALMCTRGTCMWADEKPISLDKGAFVPCDIICNLGVWSHPKITQPV